MSASDKVSSERARLNFANAVTERFGFVTDLGFSVTELSPTMVRYRKGNVELDVYHGRQSYELGFGVERDGVRYSLSDLIRTVDLEAGEQYRNFAATTQDGIVQGITQLVELVKRYAGPALRSDPEFFGALETQRKSWAEGYALDVLAGQLRPKADEAFRRGNYREASELYGRIQSLLTPAELKKLTLAKKRAQGAE
jgi:hypothetical protein